MTTPAAPSGFLGRLRDWFERDIEPRVIAIEKNVEADSANLKNLTPSLLKLANIVEALVKSADPGAAPEVAALMDGAEKVAAEIAEVVAAIEASGL